MASLADEQKRTLLAQMAQVGSAAAALHQQNLAEQQAYRQQALQAAVGSSTQPGGANDVGALLARRMSSTVDTEASRQADLGQRTAAYAGDLDLAGQANVSRRSDIDRDIGNRRVDLDREIARRRTDMERQLAMRRMEIEYEREQRRAAAEADERDPVKQAARLRAQMYLEDPDGVSAVDRRRGREDATLAGAANINASGRDPTALVEQVRQHPDYGKGIAVALEAKAKGWTGDDLRAFLEGIGPDGKPLEVPVLDKNGRPTKKKRPRGRLVNPVARDLLVAEYVASQQRNLGRATPISAYAEE